MWIYFYVNRTCACSVTYLEQTGTGQKCARHMSINRIIGLEFTNDHLT